MKVVKELDLLHNKKVLIGLNIASLLVVLISLVFFGWLAAVLYRGNSRFGILDILLTLLFSLVLLVIHELIHAFFFKFFGDQETKVRFGFKNGLAYATSLGSLYQRRQMLVIILAPFVLISTALTLAYLLDWLSLVPYVMLASLHASGCIGDFYIAYLILRQRGPILVEDTPVGMTIYQKEFL